MLKTSLSLCGHATVITRCYSNTGNTGSRFRLVKYARNESSDGSSITVAGRVEVCSNFTYKSLCHEYWDPADAHVFCQGYLRYFSPNNTISKGTTGMAPRRFAYIIFKY